MICQKCNAECMDGSTFCIKCGSSLKNPAPQPIPQPIQQPAQQPTQQPALQSAQQPTTQPVQQFPQQATGDNQPISSAPLNYFTYMIAVLLKPFKSFKEEESKLNNAKTSIIYSLIVSVIMMVITLIKTIIATIFVKTVDYSDYSSYLSGTYETEMSVRFENLKELDWLSLLGKNLLIYAGIIAVIALIYYIVSLMFKKNSNFIKLLSISATAIVPFVILGMIASPLLGEIWTPLAIVCTAAGAAYSILIFMNLVNDHIAFDNTDTKIYLHLICITILGVAGYYLYSKLMVSDISSQVNNIMNLLK